MDKKDHPKKGRPFSSPWLLGDCAEFEQAQNNLEILKEPTGAVRVCFFGAGRLQKHEKKTADSKLAATHFRDYLSFATGFWFVLMMVAAMCSCVCVCKRMCPPLACSFSLAQVPRLPQPKR